MRYIFSIPGKDKVSIENELFKSYRKTIKPNRWLNLIYQIVAWSIVWLFVFTVVNVTEDFSRYSGLLSYIGILLFLFAILSIVNSKAKNEIVEKLAEVNNLCVEFKNDYVVVKDMLGSESKVPYSSLVSVETLHKYLLLRINPCGGIVVPLSVFSDPNEKNAVVEHVNRRIGDVCNS